MQHETECVNDRRDPTRPCPHAARAAKEAVKQTYAIMGVDVDSPKDVEEYRKDLRFGGSMRKIADKGLFAFVIVVTGMGAAALFAGIGVKIKSIGGP